MDIPWFQVALVIFLTLVNALFAGSEIAFVSLREGQLQKLETLNKRTRRVVEMARNPSSFFSACQIAITLAGLFASATAAVTLAQPVKDVLEPTLGTSANAVAVTIVTLILAFFTLVFGELVPKRIAMQKSERWAVLAVDILRGVTTLTRPVVWVLEKSTDLTVKILGGDPSIGRGVMTAEEIRDMIVNEDSVTPEQKTIIAGAFEIGERTLREILVPRGKVLGIVQTTRAPDAIQLFREHGHSRAPVHAGDLDDVLGVAHLRDLVDYHGVVANRVRPALALPESLNVLESLRRMQDDHQQMAIVVNEHGGVEGIITLEDLMEEIVGEIYDEFDRDSTAVVAESDGSYVLNGSYPIHDLEDIGAWLPDGEGAYATIAGYALAQLGHIPVAGESVPGERWDVIILEVVGHAITKVRIIPVPQPDDADE